MQDEATGLEGTRGAPSQLLGSARAAQGLVPVDAENPPGMERAQPPWGAPWPSPGVSPEGTRGKVTP